MKGKSAFPIFTLAALGCALLVCWPSDADADRVQRAVIVTMEAHEAFFPLEAGSGVAVQQPVRVRHPIRLKHPVTGKWVQDELPVGEARVSMVGTRLAMIRLSPNLRGLVQIGDIVEVLVPGEAQPKPVAKKIDREEMPTGDAETQAVLGTWQRTSGQRLDTRISAWREFLDTHPDSKYRASIEEDLRVLGDLRTREPQTLIFDDPVISGVEHNSPKAVDAGTRLGLAFAVADPEDVVAAWLHYRRSGDPSFHRAVLHKDGDGYLRTNINEEDVLAPGLEYFVELANASGLSGSAIGSPDDPKYIRVHSQSLQALRETRNRSRVSMIATYLDYSTFDDRGEGDDYDDQFALFETDFLFRLRRPWLHGIRIGGGLLHGEGGYKDQALAERAGFQYGYTEFEFRTRPTRAYLARMIAGLGRNGLAFGAEGRVRFGAEEKSNLSFAVSSLEDVGFLSEVRMQWAALRDIPLGLAVGVTDQPNNGDLGVRLSGDIGYRALSWFQPTVRVSYQGRSVQHSGLGVGLGMVFDW
jgi:hypothetical protein